MVEDAGAAAVAVHGRTAAQSYSGSADWTLVNEIASRLSIPVFGSGDCIEAARIVGCADAGRCRWRPRRPQRRARESRGFWPRPPTLPPAAFRAKSRSPTAANSCSANIDMLTQERIPRSGAGGFQDGREGKLVGQDFSPAGAAGHDRWVINKVRALGSWYTKGLENGSHLRTAINSADSLSGAARSDCRALNALRPIACPLR